ncbi:MAG: tRNA (adenine(22)-N(1))-methyltransferase TrmK [Deltaproteobacteria bacterium]|nr:tRNA (adenine(22)-N(1))-methyltransferase TrmK [Deltaproteobacteria bacterium]
MRRHPRLAAILELVPSGLLVIDVGADHGHISGALPRVITTERHPHQARRRGLRWVVADGLAPFREVPCAVIAGMGARTIEAILSRGPAPAVAVLHAPDDPPRLRRWLAANGWRIDAESLAPEARRYAEVLRVVPGEEPATGLTLAVGPRLLSEGHPLLEAHLTQLLGHHRSLAAATAGVAPDKHREAQRWVEFLVEALEVRRVL